MAVTTNKTVLFLIGGVAAAAVVAYAAGVLGPAKQPPGTIAALPQPEPATVPADQKDARLPAPEAPADAPAALEAPEASAPQPESPAQAGPAPVVPPSFDVVRLEGDGSIVIAGKAAPGATVDLLVGSNVIGSAVAREEGDFAVVLDDPLKPGDYQIVLRATAPDKVVAMSVETAVVSVPATPDGQVLALVEEPGKPSQMIVLPKPEKPAQDAKPEPEAPEAPAAAETPAAAEAEPADEMQAALPEQPQVEPVQPAPVQPAPAQPAVPSGPTVRVQAVEIDGSKIFVAGVADPGRTVRGYANEILLGDAKASPDGQFLIEADRALAVGDYIIRVDALEPDGVKVAARAAVPFEREPGETIAAVAPEPEPVTPASPPAVEAPAATEPAAPEQPAQPPAAAEAPTPDAPSTEEPAVPATQPPAAVADAPASPEAESAATPPAAEAPEVAEAPAAEAATPEPAADAEAPAPVADTPAVTEPAAPAAEPDAPSVPEPSQQASAKEPAAAEPQAAEPQAAQPAAERPAAPAAEATAPSVAPEATAPAPAAEASAPAEPAAKTPPPAAVEAQPDQPLAAEPPASAATETAPAAEPAPDVASAPELPAPPASDGVGEVLAPKLQAVDSAVIIRRGDTLWRISRRVYGRGVRYSTIYLANQTQIEDPDRIWPGQVFKVPDKSNDGKADADYSRLGNRLTTVPKEQPQ